MNGVPEGDMVDEEETRPPARGGEGVPTMELVLVPGTFLRVCAQRPCGAYHSSVMPVSCCCSRVDMD